MPDNRRLDHLRRGQGEIANHIIDEYVAGRLSRRDFIRRSTVIGISVPVLGSILAACSSSSSAPRAAGSSPTGGGTAGANIKVGIVTPTAAINPLTVADQGGLDMLAQTGEYLTLSGQTLNLTPVLAESWSPNTAGDEWTFKIRQGVKFHDGTPMNADDVVYTYKLHTDKANKSQALASLGGVLTSDGVSKVDDYTVKFHLEAPNGNFPYLTSSDVYQVVIMPNNFDPTKWESQFPGTGPFVKQSYTAKQNAAFTRNESYWGSKALPSQTSFTFYDSQTAANTALTGGNIDVLGQFAVSGGDAILNGGFNVISLKSSAHRELSMRCDHAPFTDPRVRQAVALTLDRQGIIAGLFKGKADLGNDSPFAPVFPSTDTSVAQRAQNIAQAKALLAQAGHASGFSTQLITEQLQEIPALAQVVVQNAKQAGITINLKVEPSSTYYGNTFGSSDWLDATMSLVDYGHRGVPNVFLGAPLETTNAKAGTGSWNAAHFANAQYDKLVGQYAAAIDVTSQKAVAGQIQRLLLDQTPIIYPYFYNYLAATAQNVTGAYPTAIGHIFLYNCAKS